jgi:hypothetical protein
MANQWLRLWHDMPTDPKWRTIARVSGQPLALVLAVYTHMLVDASRNVTRGHVDVTIEDLASALDVTDGDIDAVLQAMQGRVLDVDRLTGWEKRQPKREDYGDASGSGAKTASQRKKEQREREKAARESTSEPENVTHCHAMSRNVTTDKDKDKDKDKEEDTDKGGGIGSSAGEPDEPTPPPPINPAAFACREIRKAGIADAAPGHLILAELLKAGATADFLAEIARECVERGKGKFAYVLATAKARMADAARARDAPLAMPGPKAAQGETFRERDSRLAAERVAQFAPAVAAKTARNNTLETIESEVANVARIESH